MCARVDLTPETSGLPLNNLRIATAASSAPASPVDQARWQRSAFRFAVAEMQPAKIPLRASIRQASVDGHTSKRVAMLADSGRWVILPEETFKQGIQCL